MSKLLPCPFCGSDARMWPSHTKADEDGSYEIIGCSNVECLIEPTTEEYLPYDEALKRWNTRAAPAPCDELKTVAYYRVNRTHLTHIPHKGYDELVTRQNAEEVIAAERAEKEKLEAAWLEAEGIISDLKAENKRLREALKNLVERFSYYADLARDGVPNIEDWAYTEGSSDISEARAALGEVKKG